MSQNPQPLSCEDKPRSGILQLMGPQGERFFFKNLFIYFWLRWVFVAAHGLFIAVASLVAEHGLQVLRLQQLWHAGFSSCGSRALERRLSSCGTWAQLLRSMWHLPGLGFEPVSPALAGRFLITAPPGKPNKVRDFKQKRLFIIIFLGSLYVPEQNYLGIKIGCKQPFVIL